MPIYFRLTTRWMPADIEKIERDLKSGALHPRDAKMKLAWEVSSSFYGDAEADKAQETFIRMFQKHDAPQDMPKFKLNGTQTVLEVLLATDLVTSGSAGRRLLDQKGVRLDGEVLDNATAIFPHPGVLQVGKRKFIKII